MRDKFQWFIDVESVYISIDCKHRHTLTHAHTQEKRIKPNAASSIFFNPYLTMRFLSMDSGTFLYSALNISVTSSSLAPLVMEEVPLDPMGDIGRDRASVGDMVRGLRPPARVGAGATAPWAPGDKVPPTPRPGRPILRSNPI